MRRPGIDGRHQDQSLRAPAVSFRTPFRASLRTNRCHHDGNAAAVGSAQEVEIGNAECVRELQDALGGSAHGAVHALMGRR